MWIPLEKERDVERMRETMEKIRNTLTPLLFAPGGRTC